MFIQLKTVCVNDMKYLYLITSNTVMEHCFAVSNGTECIS